MKSSSVWITKRKGKKGIRYLVRWIEPGTGKNPGKTFRRLEDAQEYMVKLRKDFSEGTYCGSVKTNFREWIELHIKTMQESQRKKRAPKTIKSHREALEALDKLCKPKTINSVSVIMIDGFCENLLRQGYSPHTVNKMTRTIKSALTYAKRAGLISRNVLKDEDITVEAEPKEVKPLEVGEVTALMNAATDIRHRVVISIAYYHGLRRGEICWLSWQDVNLEDCSLKIQVGSETGKTKTKRSRWVALRQETAYLLSKLYLARTNGYVFTNPKTFYWACGKWFPELVSAAGLDHYTLQNLRQTTNTLIQDEGHSQAAAMQVLGHTTQRVNRNHYTGTLKRQQRIVVDSLPSVG
ncbi:tyrosine-type recombinase/integrase [Planctomycetota bacterium]